MNAVSEARRWRQRVRRTRVTSASSHIPDQPERRETLPGRAQLKTASKKCILERKAWTTNDLTVGDVY